MKDCGLGVCQLAPAVARHPGWCLCPPGRLGARCALYGAAHEPPRQPTPVELQVQIKAFNGFNDDGDQMRMDLHLHLRWQDPRSALAAGHYDGNDVASLRGAQELWFPYLDYSVFERSHVSSEERAHLLVYFLLPLLFFSSDRTGLDCFSFVRILCLPPSFYYFFLFLPNGQDFSFCLSSSSSF